MGSVSDSWSQVAAVVAAVETTLGKWLTDTYGLGLTEYRAAVHLSRISTRELRITELANIVGLNQSSVTRLVGRMESKSLVVRDTCPDDGRGVYAVLTDRGQDVIAEIHVPYEEKISELLQNAAARYPQLEISGRGKSFETVAGLIS